MTDDVDFLPTGSLARDFARLGLAVRLFNDALLSAFRRFLP